MTTDGILAGIGGVIATLFAFILAGFRSRIHDIEDNAVSKAQCEGRYNLLTKMASVSDDRLSKMEQKIDLLMDSTARIEQRLANGMYDGRRQ